MKTLTWKRLAPGYYVARFGREYWQEFTAELANAEWGDIKGMWVLTYPGFATPDVAYAPTLRQAKEWAAEWLTHRG